MNDGDDGETNEMTQDSKFKPLRSETEHATSRRLPTISNLYTKKCFYKLCHDEKSINIIRPLGYEKVYLPLCKVADTLYHIQGDDIWPKWFEAYNSKRATWLTSFNP